MNENQPTAKRTFRKFWFLLPMPILAICLAIMCFGSKTPQVGANDFKEALTKAAPGLNLDIASENWRWHIDPGDLPLTSFFNVSHHTDQGWSVPTGRRDGAVWFSMVDGQTKENLEVIENFKENQVLAIAIHYPEVEKPKAIQIEDEIDKRFKGMPVVLRKEPVPSPYVAPGDTN